MHLNYPAAFLKNVEQSFKYDFIEYKTKIFTEFVFVET